MLAWEHVRAAPGPRGVGRLAPPADGPRLYRLAPPQRRRNVVELHVVPDREPATDFDFRSMPSPSGTASVARG